MSQAPPAAARASSAEELRAAHLACEAEVKAAAANFYYAFRLLPRRKRDALHAVYLFCRRADDLADGDGPPEERRGRLAAYREELDQALAERPGDPAWLVLWDAARTFSLEQRRLHEVIDGCAADCAPLRIADESDLERYCYGVAGAVGLLSAQIFGYRDGRVPELAIRLGEAMQLTNILRDLREDHERGRCYLPDSDLERFGCTEEDLAQGPRSANPTAYRALMAHEVARARRLFSEGTRLVPLVDRDSRGCPAALAGLYRALLDEIEAKDFDVQGERVSLGRGRKLRIALGAWAGATLAG